MDALWELGNEELVRFCLQDSYLRDYLQNVVTFQQDFKSHMRLDLKIIWALFWEEKCYTDDFSVKDALRPWLLFQIFKGNKVRLISSSSLSS
jgi:hypothetical protein